MDLARSTPKTEITTWALVAIGIALRIWQLAGGASLWFDEAALARNIADRSFGQLLGPLDHGQIAAPGFLLVERLLWTTFGTDWSLRLVPFASGIGSLFLMRSLARRVLTGIAVPLAVGAFSLGVSLILYSGQVKQYSSDVAIALGLTLVALPLIRDDRISTSRLALAALAGVCAVWFSSAAVFVLTGLGMGLAAQRMLARAGQRKRLLLSVIFPWAAAALAATIVAQHSASPGTMAYMKEFWHGEFMPLPPRSLDDVAWPLRGLVAVFGKPWGLQYFPASLYVILTLAGFEILWRTRRDAFLLLVGPLGVTFAAAVLHQFPFGARLILFLVPALLIACAAGVTAFAVWCERRVHYAGPFAILLFAAPPLARIAAVHPVYRLQETQAMLHWLAARRQTGDVVFTWYRAQPNMAWYGPRNGMGDAISGKCWLADPRGFLRDVDRARGKSRVWIIMADPGSPPAVWFASYLNTIGIRLETQRFEANVLHPFPLEVWRYDLGDSTHLASASAESFPVTLPSPSRLDRLECESGPLAPAPVAAR